MYPPLSVERKSCARGTEPNHTETGNATDERGSMDSKTASALIDAVMSGYAAPESDYFDYDLACDNVIALVEGLLAQAWDEGAETMGSDHYWHDGGRQFNPYRRANVS